MAFPWTQAIVKPNLNARILAEVPNGATVLDVGCGLAGYHSQLVERAVVTMLDAHETSLNDRRRKFGERAAYVQAEALSYLQNLPWCAFDVVLGVDVVEHLEPFDAKLLVLAMKRVGRKVVLFVPEGNHPQGEHSGNPWQAHKSTWHAPDLEALGFKVERWADYHAELGKDTGALFATWSE